MPHLNSSFPPKPSRIPQLLRLMNLEIKKQNKIKKQEIDKNLKNSKKPIQLLTTLTRIKYTPERLPRHFTARIGR